MYNKSKVRQPVKVEKENENFELRKRIKCLTTDKHLVNKKETVWDRLSKMKKAPSTDNFLGIIRSRPSLTTKTSQRSQAIRKTTCNQPIQLLRKPLSITSNSINKRSNVSKIVCSQKPTVDPEIDYQASLRIMPVKEILTGRSFSDESKSSSDDKSAIGKFSTTPLEYPRFNADTSNLFESLNESSEDSNEEYKLAPLMNSEHKCTSSMRILNNVHDFLRQKDNPMTLEDIQLVKETIKSDSRYRNMEKNPKLFKEILKTQLQNILKHEFAIKNALDSLESSASSQKTLEIESIEPINKILSYSGLNKETQKFEVDVIFKNVPTLDKEIEILRALGEKLEATLRSTKSHRCSREDEMPQRSITSIKNPMLRSDDKNRSVVMRKIKYEVYVLTGEYDVEVSVHIIGISHHVGIVNEFRMAQKTIVELKRESNRPFYIPGDSESVQLIPTSFKKLKETPSELLRHVKPKNSKIAFNVLEQDPIFFNNVFKKHSKNIPYVLSTHNEQYIENQFKSLKSCLCEGGDSILWNRTTNQGTTQNVKKASTFGRDLNNTIRSESRDNTEIKLIRTPTNFEPVVRGELRRRIRHCLTPMSISNYYSPKNALFKTILVGIVQMSVFIIFIMALTYPELRC